MRRALACSLTDVPPPARTEIDELTLVRAQLGDRDAFRRLVGLYERPVFALLSRMLHPSGRQSLVEDLAQETFVRVHRALPEFGRDGRLRVSSWILTIATRLALDELRRRPLATEPLDDAAAASGPRTDAQTERRLLLVTIEKAIATLTPEFRAVFLLREVHELDYESIADALGIDLGTVKSRLSRARTALRAALAGVQDD